MLYATALRCRECQREYPLEPIHVCEFCFGPLEVAYDYDAIRRDISREAIERGPASLWRYAQLLPVDAEYRIDLQAGFTPLLRADNLARKLGLRELYLKNDCVNPTWSFKDRPVAIAGSRARQFGFTTLACASTGNLANSVAAHAAKAEMESYVFIPSDLEAGKILGSAIYDPNLVAVDGNYDDVNRLCAELGDKYKWAFVNINMRPYYAEGSKTLGFEVAEQLGWRTPDHCVVPVASGSLFTKIYKGFTELQKVGLIGEIHTRMSVAQAEGCAPVVTAFREHSFNFRPVKPKTIAKSLAIGNPADGYYALKQLAETGGAATAVTDAEIIDGMKLLAETEGIFAETAGGTTVAALRHLVEEGAIHPNEVTVAFITGAGLKTQEAVADHVISPLHIAPTIESFEKRLLERRRDAPAYGAVAEAAG
ncbi:MAG TPA: threonine synthase [Dehalococcoidia bacterium]|nr:threonine synthase [Dehalococcoidia bacterium]